MKTYVGEFLAPLTMKPLEHCGSGRLSQLNAPNKTQSSQPPPPGFRNLFHGPVCLSMNSNVLARVSNSAHQLLCFLSCLPQAEGARGRQLRTDSRQKSPEAASSPEEPELNSDSPMSAKVIPGSSRKPQIDCHPSLSVVRSSLG